MFIYYTLFCLWMQCLFWSATNIHSLFTSKPLSHQVIRLVLNPHQLRRTHGERANVIQNDLHRRATIALLLIALINHQSEDVIVSFSDAEQFLAVNAINDQRETNRHLISIDGEGHRMPAVGDEHPSRRSAGEVRSNKMMLPLRYIQLKPPASVPRALPRRPSCPARRKAALRQPPVPRERPRLPGLPHPCPRGPRQSLGYRPGAS